MNPFLPTHFHDHDTPEEHKDNRIAFWVLIVGLPVGFILISIFKVWVN